MSRAFLGKMSVFIYKWLKKTVFAHRIRSMSLGSLPKGDSRISPTCCVLQKTPLFKSVSLSLSRASLDRVGLNAGSKRRFFAEKSLILLKGERILRHRRERSGSQSSCCRIPVATSHTDPGDTVDGRAPRRRVREYKLRGVKLLVRLECCTRRV